MAAGYGHVLKQAVAAFIAHRAIMGMIDHQPFNDLTTEIDHIGIGGGDHHAVSSLLHTAHLNPFNRPLQKLDGAHPAGPEGPQSRMKAKPGNDDPQLFGRFDDFGPFGDLDGQVVDNDIGHNGYCLLIHDLTRHATFFVA